MPDISSLLDLSPPVLMISAINFFIWVFKYSFPKFPRNKIPLLCLFIGACAWPPLSSDGSVPYTFRSTTIAEIFMGIILGSASVGLHKVFIKQLDTRFGIKLEGETEFIVKSENPVNVEIIKKEGSDDKTVTITESPKL